MPNKLLKNNYLTLKNKPTLDIIPDGVLRKLITQGDQLKINNLPDNTTLEIGKKIDITEKGVPNGVATLDNAGLVPSTQLPSYVDDVLEFPNKGAFPVSGEKGKIYIEKVDDDSYRWSGSNYIKMGTADLEKHLSDFTNPHKVTKGQVGLGNVDNTSDANKPVSTLLQQALDLKLDKGEKGESDGVAPLDNNKLIPLYHLPKEAKTIVENNLNSNNTIHALSAKQGKILNSDLQSHKSDKTNPHQVGKAQVGLGNVDNTKDIDKPISTKQKAVLNLKLDADKRGVPNGVASLDASGDVPISQMPPGTFTVISDSLSNPSATEGLSAGKGKQVNDDLQLHKVNTTNPHNVTQTQVGLSNVNNTNDMDKPVSNAQQTALNLKMDKSVRGKPNGVASLGPTGLVPVTELPPEALLGSIDNLTSSETNTSLSANQGRILESHIQLHAADKTNPHDVN